MAKKVYVTNECENKATAHNLRAELHSLAKQIVNKNDFIATPLPSHSPCLRKRISSAHRDYYLLLYPKFVSEGWHIIFFVDLIEATKFEEIKDFSTYSKKLIESDSDKRGKNQKLDLILKKINETPITAQESVWLQSLTLLDLNEDYVVQESKKFPSCIQIGQEIPGDTRPTAMGVFECIQDLLGVNHPLPGVNSHKYTKKRGGNQDERDYYLYYCHFPKNNIIYLHSVYCDITKMKDGTFHSHEENKDLLREVAQELKLSSIDLVDFDNKDISKFEDQSHIYNVVALNSRNRYEGKMFAEDETLWENEILKTTNINLALSEEEIVFLKTIFDAKSAVRYPAFVNGRAGSGKTLLLDYVLLGYFALAIKEHLDNSGDALKPVYIVASAKLAGNAWDRLFDNLKKSHAFTSSEVYQALWRKMEGDDREKKARTEKYLEEICLEWKESVFKTFSDFLSQIAGDYDPSFRDSTKNVDFARFSEWFYKTIKSDEITADAAWCLIRTYIKGMAIDGEFLSVNEIESLGQEKLPININKIQDFYTHVFKPYQSFLTAEGCYDAQDLSRTALKSIVRHGLREDCKYGAVLCDEAQDFTVIDHQIILRLSSFCGAVISTDKIKDIPVVMAGDPLQTINPTGFNWGLIESEYFSFARLLYDVQNLKLHTKDLEHNYRSGRGIVDFCNYLLVLRRVLGARTAPQKHWGNVAGNVGVCDFSKLAHPEDLIKVVNEDPDITIVVNCENETELKKVKEVDPFLSQIKNNIGIPTGVKGMEFDRVIVYNFFKNIPSGPNSLITQLKTGEAIKKGSYGVETEYYLNKLYVACSRAKTKLIIIDENIAPLQNLVSSGEGISKILGADNGFVIPAQENGESNVIKIIQEEDLRSFITEQARDMVERRAKENAEQFLASALREDLPENTRLLHIENAINSYSQIGDIPSTQHAKAVKAKIEHKYREAGNLFAECAKHKKSWEDAVYSYWHGKEYALINILPTKPGFECDTECEALIEVSRYLADDSKFGTTKKKDYLRRFTTTSHTNEKYSRCAAYADALSLAIQFFADWVAEDCRNGGIIQQVHPIVRAATFLRADASHVAKLRDTLWQLIGVSDSDGNSEQKMKYTSLLDGLVDVYPEVVDSMARAELNALNSEYPQNIQHYGAIVGGKEVSVERQKVAAEKIVREYEKHRWSKQIPVESISLIIKAYGMLNRSPEAISVALDGIQSGKLDINYESLKQLMSADALQSAPSNSVSELLTIALKYKKIKLREYLEAQLRLPIEARNFTAILEAIASPGEIIPYNPLLELIGALSDNKKPEFTLKALESIFQSLTSNKNYTVIAELVIGNNTEKRAVSKAAMEVISNIKGMEASAFLKYGLSGISKGNFSGEPPKDLESLEKVLRFIAGEDRIRKFNPRDLLAIIVKVESWLVMNVKIQNLARELFLNFWAAPEVDVETKMLAIALGYTSKSPNKLTKGDLETIRKSLKIKAKAEDFEQDVVDAEQRHLLLSMRGVNTKLPTRIEIGSYSVEYESQNGEIIVKSVPHNVLIAIVDISLKKWKLYNGAVCQSAGDSQWSINNELSIELGTKYVKAKHGNLAQEIGII